MKLRLLIVFVGGVGWGFFYGVKPYKNEIENVATNNTDDGTFNATNMTLGANDIHFYGSVIENHSLSNRASVVSGTVAWRKSHSR